MRNTEKLRSEDRADTLTGAVERGQLFLKSKIAISRGVEGKNTSMYENT
jgi:hypothetical protein